jgi:hypothetical protein
MARKAKPPTQETRPVKGEPVEIPVPKRKQVEQFMRDVAADRKPEHKPTK